MKLLTLQRNFSEVTGSRVSYHYARNIYIKVFLYIVVLWMLGPSKCFIETTNLFENTYRRCDPGIHPGSSPVVSISRIFSIRNTYFQEHLNVLFLFFLTAMCYTLFDSICFLKKSDGLYFFLQAAYF